MTRLNSVNSQENQNKPCANNPPSNLKKFGFAIFIIVSIGGLAIAGIGLGGLGVQQGWWQAGALSNLGQIKSIFMMAAGGGGAIALLIVLSVNSVKNHQENKMIKNAEASSSIKIQNETQGETQGEMICGPGWWEEIWGVKIVEDVPNPPEINWGEIDPFFNKAYRENFVLFYFPEKIMVNEKEEELTLNILKELKPYQLSLPNERLAHILRKKPLKKSGWALMSTRFIPDNHIQISNNHKSFEETEEGYRMPSALEATVFRLTMLSLRNYGWKTYFSSDIVSNFTRCAENINNVFPIVGWVSGHHPHKKLEIMWASDDYHGSLRTSYGITVIKKF